MEINFTHTILGKTSFKVHRLGLAASYWPGKKTIYKAIDEGLNCFFCFGIDKQDYHMPRIQKIVLLSLFLTKLIASSLFATTQTISGFVYDESNRETLIGANIFIEDTTIGTTSNNSGYYIINRAPVGTFRLVFSFLGYQTKKIQLTLRPNQSRILNVTLKPQVLKGEEIEIVAERMSTEEIKTSVVKVTPTQLRSAPQMAEADLMRMLQTLPGVLTLSEFSSGLYIRGGTPDQNLILLDGTEVYNINHLFGIFSTFDVDAVKQVQMIRGGFPAEYGSRMSSVLDITNKDGNQKEFQGKLAIGLVSTKTSLQGPVGKGAWFFSGRRTYIDYILNTAEKFTSGSTKEILELIPDYYFYDAHFKLFQDLNYRNKLAVTFYKGQDNMRFEVDPFNMSLKWGNQALTAKWTHIFNEKLFANFYSTFSRYEILMEEDDVMMNAHFDNSVNDLTIKADLEYFPSDGHVAKFGCLSKYVQSKYFQQFAEQKALLKSGSQQSCLYAQDNWTLSPLFEIQFGFRLNIYDPHKFINTWDRIEYQDKWRVDFEPRLAWRYRLTDKITLKSSWGRYLQYMTIVPFGNADFSFMDIWFPSDNSYPPGEAYHYIAGFETKLPLGLHFDWEIYYKDLPHVYEFDPNQNQFLKGSDLFYNGKGFAYGIDFYLEKNIGKLAGWVSYSLGWTKRKFPEINNGKFFFPKYDRRHYLNLIATYQLSQRWQTNFSWTYGTGQAFTQPVSHYRVDLPDRSVFLVIGEDRNISRLPPYHRMDLGIRYTRTVQKRWLNQWAFYFQIYNLYNRRNIWFRNVNAREKPPETLEIRMLPIIPTLGVEFYF